MQLNISSLISTSTPEVEKLLSQLISVTFSSVSWQLYKIILNNKIDLRSRLEIIKLNKDLDDGSFRVLSLGIKYSLIKNRHSFYLPISFSKSTENDANDYKQIEPTLLFTVPLNDIIDINSSIKVLLPFFEDDDNDPFYAINIGFGFNNFYYLFPYTAFFLPATVFLAPLRERALVRGLWPRTGSPRRWRLPL